MEFRFFGAAGEVTGSMYLLDTGNDQILFDCGKVLELEIAS
jgi:metallo-beta-lactamase family protein